MPEPLWTDPLWTSGEIAAATGGRLAGEPFAATGVSIDTRTIKPGDLFVALAGVRDGHDFIDQALAKGAVGALATREGAGARILVGDTLKALEQMGLAARDRAPNARRGAVTGSVGKTSVTQAVAAGLALAGPSHASVESYNNHIGVPLTLARMPRETRRGVFEIGMNHADEIEPLSLMVAPHAVAITTVGPVHVENFTDGEIGVARAKAEIFAGMAPGGAAILNADNIWFELLKGEAERAGAKVIAFGSGGSCDARLTGFAATTDSAEVRAALHGRDLSFPIRQTGVQWGLNSLAVLLLLEALDVDLHTALKALADFAPLEGRGFDRLVHAAKGDFTLVDDSFNANSLSTGAALASLGARQTAGRRIVALTDMLELGAQGPSLHAALAEPIAAAKVDLVFCAGPLMDSLWQALPPTRRGGYAETAEQLAPQLVDAVAPGDVVLVKGSKGSKASLLAKALAALDVGAGEVV
jgi:UDP-N-acetylmuramoyl-tripeptide--D-alanyl-D-alanine ligase